MKKAATFILALLLQYYAFPQNPRELNIGGFVGTEVLESTFAYFPIAATIEYRPGKARFSMNTDLQMLFIDNSVIFTVPFYLKFIIGNKFRVCPGAGGFIRNNGNYGWTAGLSVEYRIKKLLLFAKADYYRDYYQTEGHNHFGGGYKYTTTTPTVWIGFGVKRSIFK